MNADRLGRTLRVLLGVVLLVLGGLPIYRLIDVGRTGLAGASTVALSDIYLATVWWGLLLLVPVALIAAMVGPTPGVLALGRRADALLDRLAQPRAATFAAVLAAFALLVSAAFSLLVLDGRPNHVDAVAQLVHARYWSEGLLAGPLEHGAFRTMQNAVFTGDGWVSQYPPGHVLLLTPFVAAGVPWAAGPLLVACCVFFGALALRRLLPVRPRLARAAAASLAVSPFLLLLGSTYMNHITVCAALTAAAYALCRAWQGRALWALPAGAALGLAFATRPLAALAIGATLSMLVPFTGAVRPHARQLARVWLLTLAGAVPFVVLLGLYNHHFFGSPLTFGYDVALGPRTGLGWHVDPWGNMYGLREAIGFTGADMLSLGVHLLETPLSAVLVVGLFLVLARALAPGERVLLGWAVAPVAANLMYWHHGAFMGPRMLYEAAPAWLALTVIAAVALVRRVPAEPFRGRFHLRTGAAAAAIAALALGLFVLTPQRALSYGGSFHGVMRVPVPAVETPALVFVHEGWTSRLAMTLAAAGFRLDIVETLLRQNATCEVQLLADAAVARDAALVDRLVAGLDTVPRAAALPASVEVAPGSSVRVAGDAILSDDCLRHAYSDRFGVISLTPLLWKGDVAADRVRGAFFVRDLGPERNAQLIAASPQREPWLYAMAASDDETPVLMPYDEGMDLLWHTSVQP